MGFIVAYSYKPSLPYSLGVSVPLLCPDEAQPSSMVVKNRNTGVPYSWLHHLPAGLIWACYLTSVNLGLFVYKMKVLVPFSLGCYKGEMMCNMLRVSQLRVPVL